MPEIRLPPGLAETEISIFANAKDTAPKPVRLGPILSAIKNGRWADPIAKLRELLDAGNREAYDEQKKDLPAVTLSGSFEKRNAGGLIRHSGLLQIDLDHLGNPAEVRDQLAADPHVAAALLSPSAQGVKGVMLMPPGDAERHKHAFNAAVNYLQETYGLENDRACKDVCRMMFVSHDPGLRTNPDAVVLDVKRWTPEEPQPSFVSSEERPPSEENERVRDALTHLSSEAYADWIRICAALKNSNLPGAFELWHEWSAKTSTYQGSEDCQGTWDALTVRTASGGMLPVDAPAQLRRSVPLGRGAKRAVVVLAVMVVLLATGVVPPAAAALLAAVALVLTRAISVPQAFQSISWTTIVLIAGMIPLSTAFIQTGTADLVAGWVLAAMSGASAHVVLLALCLLTLVLGQLISNAATVLIVAPIAVSIAATLDLSVMPFMMALTVAGAAAFLTPIATPANLMIMEPGGYRFGDYWRLGLPLAALFVAFAVLYVPFVWPF